MSSRIRFNAAADVFAAFPDLARFIRAPDGPVEALAHAQALIDVRPPSAALAYLAHLLPRREAIWWGCQCVSAILGEAAKDEGFRLATDWVRNPDDGVRREALAYAQGDLRGATTWLARAVGYSGGSLLAPDQPASLPAPEACAQSVNAAVVIAATSVPPTLILPWFRACAEAGVRFASGEDAKVISPVTPSPADSSAKSRAPY